MTDDGGTRLFDELVRRHGGADVLGVVGLAVVRGMAVLLSAADMDARAAVAATELSKLLPQRQPATVDLTRYSDQELHELHVLIAKGAGEAPPASPARRKRSPRVRDALRLTAAVDRAAARIAVGPHPNHETPDEAERGELRRLINELFIGLNATTSDVLGFEPACMSERAQPPPIEQVPIELPANVIPMPQR